MGGIDWDALVVACELIGIPDKDIEIVIVQLTVLRDRKK